MRGGDHSKDIREYEITTKGIVLGDRLKGYRGLITGVPEPFGPGGRGDEGPAGVAEEES